MSQAVPVVETIAVALMMGGGPAAVYAAMAMEALDQFQQASAGGLASPGPQS